MKEEAKEIAPKTGVESVQPAQLKAEAEEAKARSNEQIPAPKQYGYTDFVNALEKQNTPTEDEQKKYDRRMKALYALGALSEMGSAIGNMVGAVNGATPYEAEKGTPRLSAQYQRMLEKRQEQARYYDRLRAQGYLQDIVSERQARRQGQQYLYDMDKLRAKNESDAAARKDNNAVKREMHHETIEAAKERADAANAARIRTAQMRASRTSSSSSSSKSHTPSTTEYIDSNGVAYDMPKGYMRDNAGSIYNSMLREGLPAIEPKLDGSQPTATEIYGYVMRNFDGKKYPNTVKMLGKYRRGNAQETTESPKETKSTETTKATETTKQNKPTRGKLNL